MRILFLGVLIVLFSCESKDEVVSNLKYYSIDTIVVDDYTNELITNTNFFYKTCAPYKSVNGDNYCEEIFSESIESHLKGTFKMKLSYTEKTNNLIYGAGDLMGDYESTHKNSITMEELLNKDELIIKINKLTRVNIQLKNIGVKKSNDEIKILEFIYEDTNNNTYLYPFEIFNSENENETYQREGITYDLLIWKGSNVNSNFTSEVKSNHDVSIKYQVKENGEITTHQTKMTKMKRDVLNFVEIEY